MFLIYYFDSPWGKAMKKLAILTAIVSASVFSLSAQAYQAEVGGSYSYTDRDNGSDTNNFAIDGTYYFKPVQTRNSPLNEAAFLDRASNVNLDFRYGDNKGTKDTDFNAGIEYFVPSTDFYVSARAGRDETKVNKNDYKNRVATYGAEVGYIPTPGLLLALGVTGYEQKKDEGNVRTKTDGADPTVRAKYVTQVGNYDMNFEASGAFGDLDEYRVRSDFYIDKTLSVGVDYYNNDLTKADEWGVSAKKFFNQNVSLEGRAGFGDDDNNYAVRAAYRF